MGKILSVLFITIILSGCNLLGGYDWMPPAEIDTERKLFVLISSIKREPLNIDHWRQPETTYNGMIGDCEDRAGLIASILKYNFGHSNIRMIGCISRSSGTPHMVVKADGNYYESSTGEIIEDFKKQYIRTNSMSFEMYCFLAEIF